MLKKTGSVRVRKLMVDDWFKLAGTMYRITKFRTNKVYAFIHATPADNTVAHIELAVPLSSRFTIYNQK